MSLLIFKMDCAFQVIQRLNNFLASADGKIEKRLRKVSKAKKMVSRLLIFIYTSFCMVCTVKCALAIRIYFVSENFFAGNRHGLNVVTEKRAPTGDRKAKAEDSVRNRREDLRERTCDADHQAPVPGSNPDQRYPVRQSQTTEQGTSSLKEHWQCQRRDCQSIRGSGEAILGNELMSTRCLGQPK